MDMMLEYHRGEWSSWNVAKTVKIYNEAFPDGALPLDGLEEQGVEVKSPRGSAHNDS